MNTSNNKAKRSCSSEDSKRSPAKRQHRNENEKRRRDLFSQLISNLEDILNIDINKSLSNQQTNKISSLNNKLDKASILSETAQFLRKHQNDIIFQKTPSSTKQINEKDSNSSEDIVDFGWKPSSNLISIEEWLQIVIESMNCFLLIAKSDPHNGQIVYVSSNISSLLDYSQNELLNRSLFELILSRDHDQLRDYLLKDHRVLDKCNLSWRRATADEYEQCTIIGAFRQINKKNENEEKYLISIVEVNTLDRCLVVNNDQLNNQFTTRLNLQAKFIYIDPKAREYLGYSSYELIGHTHFDFVHPDDLPIIIRAHQIWKENGNGKSDSYRFLSKGQQWISLQTQCQVQINSWTGKPESYICTSFTLTNPTESIHKQVTSSSSTNIYSYFPNISIENCSRINSMLTNDFSLTNSSSDSQITSFLSHLNDENYRRNIREKLNQRKLSKEAEIRMREEEIKIIQDIIIFIDQFQSNQTIQQQDSIEMVKSSDRSPLTNPIEEYSSYYSPKLSRPNVSSKDELIVDGMLTTLNSPYHQYNDQISSPLTPYSILSRPSPITPTQLSSPNDNTNISQDFNNKSVPSTSSSSSSSSSTNHSNEQTTTTTTSKKSSFNRSLPHSLVS